MRRKLVLVAMVAVLMTGSLGCSASGSDEGAASSGDGTTTSVATDDDGAASTESDGPTERTAEPHAIVASLAPTEADLEAGEQLVLRELGDEVENQVTLDYCGFAFESEDARLARRQLNIAGADDTPAGSVEVVLYEGGADVAVDELRDAIDQCPEDELVDPTLAGQPAYVWADEPLPEDDLGDLAEDRVAVTVTVTPEEGEPLAMTAIWQVRGDALIGTYADDPDRALALAAAGNERLEAATPADLGL